MSPTPPDPEKPVYFLTARGQRYRATAPWMFILRMLIGIVAGSALLAGGIFLSLILHLPTFLTLLPWAAVLGLAIVVTARRQTFGYITGLVTPVAIGFLI